VGRTPAGYRSIRDTADELGITEWDVLDLIEAHRLESVTFVQAASLTNYRETA
jgi:hypothetical protein